MPGGFDAYCGLILLFCILTKTKNNMRKRFNRNAVCSSENYLASRKAHRDFLQERHTHFCNILVSGELQIDVPEVGNGSFQPRFKTITIWGKEMRVTIEEYNTHYTKCGFWGDELYFGKAHSFIPYYIVADTYFFLFPSFLFIFSGYKALSIKCFVSSESRSPFVQCNTFK